MSEGARSAAGVLKRARPQSVATPGSHCLTGGEGVWLPPPRDGCAWAEGGGRCLPLVLPKMFNLYPMRTVPGFESRLLRTSSPRSVPWGRGGMTCTDERATR